MTDWKSIAKQIQATTGRPFTPRAPQSVGGGCINAAVRLSDGRESYFVKTNAASSLEMFEAELAGLHALAATRTLRVPEPLCCAIAGDQAYLVLEYIDTGPARGGSAAQAGRQLAALHRSTGQRFGWYRDNTIGATHQANTESDEWAEFWRTNRLGFQLRLAADNGYRGPLQRRGEQLLERLPELLEHAPLPSLLHGDLWGGNLSYDREGNPVVYDPAVYYGDREADLAMTELFGGFSGDFYAAYREAWPLDPGYAVRKILYNLYHVLNHLNLFGGGYLGQAQNMTDRLLAHLS
jgi:fructosamine-3-kinase